MTLSEISYSIFEILRQGSLVDDERLSIRLVDSWVQVKRAQYLKDILDKGQSYPENSIQHIDIAIGNTTSNSIGMNVSTVDIPKLINTKFGSSIREVASLDFNQYNFTLVNNNHFKMSGNGKFYASSIFVTYFKNKLYFKSKSAALNTIEECRISGLFEDPSEIPGFDVETDEYPIDVQGVDYIKEAAYRVDVRMFLNGVTDEVSDSSGEIKR